MKGLSMVMERKPLQVHVVTAALAALVCAGCEPSGKAAEIRVPRPEGKWVTSKVELPGLGVQQVTYYEEKEGQAVFEGDILLDVRPVPSHGGQSVGQRHVGFRWPNRVVPYVIDPGLVDTARVTAAIAHWELKTSIRFRARTTETAYVRFVRGAPGTECRSQVGRTGFEQQISLADNCDTGITIHEIGHAVGLWHEQSRSDRDDYVVINLANVIAGEEHNFAKQGALSMDVGPYDFGSIMHYGPYDFSANGGPTIERKDGGGTAGIGQRNGLSAGDVQGVEFLYGRPIRLQSALNTSRCLEIAGGNTAPGTPVQLWDCNGTPAQMWVHTPEQELRSVLSPNLCLDVFNGDWVPGTPVQVWPCNGTPAQRWTFENVAVRSGVGPNLCLDVYNGNPSLGTRLQTMTCYSTAAQEWYRSNE
jgi:hypothetical protein